jgi:succinyl-diaminopimelate desuccinylase
MDAIELTQKLIQFNTVNPPGREAAIARFIGDILLEYGFEIDYPEHATDRLNLVATKGLSPEVDPIVLTGHLDVVPLGAANWTMDPFAGALKDGKIYGRGSSDMKSGVAAMTLAAIEIFEESAPKGGIKLIYTADEELGCNGAKTLCDSGYDIGRANAIIVGEPSGNVPFIGHKGGLFALAKTKGVTVHSSMPHLGENAIYKAANAIGKIEALKFEVPEDSLLGFPTINVGKIKGGLNFNSVPDHTEFTVDIRTTTELPNHKAMDTLKDKLGSEVEIEQLTDLNAIATSEEDPFIKMVYQICGIDPNSIHFKSTAPYLTDASVLTPWLGSTPTIVLGPGEVEMAHQIDEFCYVDKILQAVKLYKKIIQANAKLNS